jgi:hypothetical protein
MPKTKRMPQERENWSWNGFIVGMVFGAPFYFSATGYYNSSPFVRMISGVLIVFAFIVAIVITIYNAVRHRPLFSPLADGFIAGFCLSATFADWYLHGIHFP